MQENVNSSFLRIVKHSAYIGSLCGMGYFIVIVLIHFAGYSYSEMINWVFRMTIVLAGIWAIISFRIRANNKISFGKGFIVGMLTSLILGCWLAIAALVFYNFVAPTYHTEAKNIYKQKRTEQMYARELINKRLRLEEGKPENVHLNAEDSVGIQSGLAKHIKQTAFFFTANAQAIINFVFSLIWGVGISISAAYMAKR